MQIKGPNGQVVDVDPENRLKVNSIAFHQDKHLNQEGRYWSLYGEVTPVGANDYFFYIKNTGIFNLSITDIRISSSVPGTLYYERVTGTPIYVTNAGAGTNTQVTNRNLNNPNEPDAIIKHDTDITGLTSQGVLMFEECDVADRLHHAHITSTIIIPQGQAVAFRRQEATGLIKFVVSLSRQEF